jgi:NitT/TauT family transport system permease protein
VVAGIAVFVIGWKLVVVIGGLAPYILPPPETVAGRFVGAWLDGTVWPHFQATMVEIVIGSSSGRSWPPRRLRPREAICSSGGLAVSRAAQAFDPVLAPLLVFWFGPGCQQGRHLRLIVFFPVAIATMVGIRSVDARLIELGRSSRHAVDPDHARDPGRAPNIFGGLRVGVTLAVVGAVVGEWAGASKGLAVLINLARGSLFDIPLMFAALVTIALVGVALYLVIVGIERRLIGVR